MVNNFYQNNHVLTEEDEVQKNDWLFILNLTNHLLKEMLSLIMIDIPTFM